MENFGAELARRLDELRLTPAQLSRLSGVSDQTINNILKDPTRPRRQDTVRALQRALDGVTPPDQLPPTLAAALAGIGADQRAVAEQMIATMQELQASLRLMQQEIAELRRQRPN